MKNHWLRHDLIYPPKPLGVMFHRKWKYGVQLINTDTITPETFVKITKYDENKIGLSWFWEIENQFFEPPDHINKIYKFTEKSFYTPKQNDFINLRPEFKFTTILNLYDGCGWLLERHTLLNCVVQVISFGELDYGGTDAELTLKLKYENCITKDYYDKSLA